MCISLFYYISWIVKTRSYLSVRDQGSQSPKGWDKFTVLYILYLYLLYFEEQSIKRILAELWQAFPSYNLFLIRSRMLFWFVITRTIWICRLSTELKI